MKNKISGAEAMLRALLAEGVDTVFAYPGGSIIKVFDALYDHCCDIRQILVRHEQGATHAAQGYARVSGRIGVAIVTSGPGATNTITGISDAMLDSTPIVVIAGQVGTDALGTDAFQEIDLVGVTQPITKWNYQIRRAEDIAWAVARAFYIAGSGRPGPVVLDFTKTAQTGMIDFRPEHIEYIRSYIPSPDPDMGQIEAAVSLIDKASKPLVLVGHGVELGQAEKELREFIEKGGLPAARTLLGLAALPTDHPLNMGMLGMHGNLAPNIKTNECDLLIAVGMRFSDRVTGTLSTYARQAKIIHLDIDKSEFGKNVKPDVAVLGDCRKTLKLITERMAKADHKEWIESFKPLDKEEFDKVINNALYPASGPLKMGEVVKAVSDQSPDNSILVTDVGQNQMFSARYFKFRSKRSIVTSGGLGTMGFCLPAAIGATFGAPERMVFAFQGDGGFQMNIQELGTVMQTGAPVKMIVLNNTYLGNVRQWQQMMFNCRYSCTHMMNPDYSKVAAGYGIPYKRVEKREELKDSIAKMINFKGAFILEVIVMDEENVMPMIPPGNSVDNMIFSLADN
ncbi:MAG TPA: biosynthetic-type acetolactate synthase large subunit [Bacteroidaceae bacterium]|jgi:acetolactate synthase-1/2/3 large subunit|nr:biosynthetic-type acetolactate synthase large subunit [Bacteroidaceae bacterium]HOD67923.1 biosynthetic-type acetolactate synthase large subunit [Bacteroidaceae bacterium]HQL25459.1 biosynthetic-type acetolactate synthase large subunit [Bacteroidaceae bacterium]